MNDRSILVVASIDVEEEGLFSGIYRCRHLSFRNLSHLSRLEVLCQAGIKPTLFCVHGVFMQEWACDILNLFRVKYASEIGCHLHHWNTPPFVEESLPQYVRNVDSTALSDEMFLLKVDKLIEAATLCLGERPLSFRMGRWDLYPDKLAMLMKAGIKCDASLRPFHAPSKRKKCPDHFNVPNDPFWLKCDGGKIFEVPLTVVPIYKKLPVICDHLGSFIRGSYKNWGALALLPVYHPLWLMKLVTKMHILAGGKVLSLAWHSSEMMPGGAPHIPGQKQARRLLDKIRLWFEWLSTNYNVQSVTVSELATTLESSAPVVEAAICMPHTGI